jgi:hypothetical protein
VNSPEDRPVGPKHVEIRRFMNEIEIVTSVGFFISYAKSVVYLCIETGELLEGFP